MSAPGVKQAGRYLEFKAPSLAADTLVINSFSGSESLSHLYHYNLELLAPPDKKVTIKDLLGKPCHVGVRVDQKVVHHFHGIVSRISQGNRDKRFQQFEAEVVPWLWLLTRRSDCRI